MTKEKSFMTTLMTCSINKMRIGHSLKFQNALLHLDFRFFIEMMTRLKNEDDLTHEKFDDDLL